MGISWLRDYLVNEWQQLEQGEHGQKDIEQNDTRNLPRNCSIGLYTLFAPRSYQKRRVLRDRLKLRLHAHHLTLEIQPTAGTAVPPTTVTGTQGHSVSLHPGIPVGPDITEVEWSRVWPRNRIVKYSNGNIDYSSNELYKNRITFHSGNISLEIHDLRRNDSGEYIGIFTAASSGDESNTTVRLEVYEPVSGANITVQNITGTCNLTLTCSVASGNPISFSLWRGGEVTGDNNSHHFWRHEETIQVHCTAEMEDVVYGCKASNPISEDTAQVRLGNVCNLDTCTSKPTAVPIAVTLVIVLSVAGTLLIFALTVILRVTWRRRADGREGTSGTEDQAETGIIYTDLQWMQKNRSVEQPPKGNDRFAGPEVVAETTPTEYAAVMYRASPSRGWPEDRAPGQYPVV
ncbi:SLAM family member 8-like [Hypanus sabinus]|uniref:SLAM family member 8-like n=1 Tax=Hypanus sabinus TaxID=79690 RepID=UPI0028C43C6B|nr:SLAM family member 8-like [Hypanus sabinus]